MLESSSEQDACLLLVSCAHPSEKEVPCRDQIAERKAAQQQRMRTQAG